MSDIIQPLGTFTAALALVAVLITNRTSLYRLVHAGNALSCLAFLLAAVEHAGRMNAMGAPIGNVVYLEALQAMLPNIAVLVICALLPYRWKRWHEQRAQNDLAVERVTIDHTGKLKYSPLKLPLALDLKKAA